MTVRIELLANRVQGDDAALLQRAGELTQREFDAFADLLQVVGRVGNRRFEAVDHPQQMPSAALDRALLGLGLLFLKAAATCELQNGDRQLGTLTRIEQADGAGKIQFKRFPRNYSHRGRAGEILGYSHYRDAIRWRLSAPDKWPMLQ